MTEPTNRQPPRDPLVDDVHRVRQQMWDDCGGSLDGLIEFLRAAEAEHPERVISIEELDRRRASALPPAAEARDATPPTA
ncbi:MAG: hypothetical protein C4547_11410 [Phycisphaerales bacterium]|nr:MAG: hypothetical protein C4547_11410 [Phycisphaerales bacterium]